MLLEWPTEMSISVTSSCVLVEEHVEKGVSPHLALNLPPLSVHSNFRRAKIFKRLILAIFHHLYDQDLKHGQKSSKE